MLDDKHLSAFFERMLLAKPERIREVVEFRMVVEPGVAALAASRRSEEDVARIRRLVERQKTASPEDYAELDAKFHMALARATGNEVVWEMAAVLRDHQRILKALEDADPEACRQAMRDHLENVGQKAGDAASSRSAHR